MYILDGKVLGRADQINYEMDNTVSHFKLLTCEEAKAKYGDAGEYGALEIVSHKPISTDYDFWIAVDSKTDQQTIKFKIAKSRQVRIAIYTAKGLYKEVLNANFEGDFEFLFDKNQHKSGVYKVKLELEGQKFYKSIVIE